jgi:hypothetical protein
VTTLEVLDAMPSYFLAETLKYLYLLFDGPGHWVHGSEPAFVFTTEGHPLPVLGTTLYTGPAATDCAGFAPILNGAVSSVSSSKALPTPPPPRHQPPPPRSLLDALSRALGVAAGLKGPAATAAAVPTGAALPEAAAVAAATASAAATRPPPRHLRSSALWPFSGPTDGLPRACPASTSLPPWAAFEQAPSSSLRGGLSGPEWSTLAASGAFDPDLVHFTRD